MIFLLSSIFYFRSSVLQFFCCLLVADRYLFPPVIGFCFVGPVTHLQPRGNFILDTGFSFFIHMKCHDVVANTPVNVVFAARTKANGQTAGSPELVMRYFSPLGIKKPYIPSIL